MIPQELIEPLTIGTFSFLVIKELLAYFKKAESSPEVKEMLQIQSRLANTLDAFRVIQQEQSLILQSIRQSVEKIEDRTESTSRVLEVIKDRVS